MAPPPVLRRSPVRERHRRGRSVESALNDRDQEDELALFQDMQTKEKDNFLHHSGDDSDESISLKLRGLSDFRLSISTPVNRESNDLMNNDADKNDYDWLLTPPDTPLFPSLDERTSPVSISQRGRPQSQPIRIPGPLRSESSSRAGRSSASPRRSSPSPGSSSVNTYSKRRASPGPSASVSPTLRSLTPSVRVSTATSKPSTPPIRSTTPTLRRSSIGSGSVVAKGGSSSGKAIRGSSSSPKLQSWHSNNPEFAAEPPPNLRTSISDRPTSSTRGSSPASRRGLSPVSKRGSSPASGHGIESGTRRQSVSPTVSRSASSSNSHERDRFSSQSKGSAVSSCEDEMDSVQSTFSGKRRTSTVGVLGRQVTRKQEPYPHSKIQSFSNRSTRSTAMANISMSSAPKRSFDSAGRQTDVRRNSQSMFRPLLSSAPATSFYANKASSIQRRTYSMNSSMTTSSNASSEHGASVMPDIEGSEHDQDDAGSEWEKSSFPHVQEDVLVVDKIEVKHTDSKTRSPGIDGQQEDGPDHDVTGSISVTTDIHLDAHKDYSFSEMKSSDLDYWKNGKVVVDMKVKSLPNVINNGLSDCNHNDAIGSTILNDHVAGMVNAKVGESDSHRNEFARNIVDDSADGTFVDIQVDVPGKNSILKRDNNGTRRYLQASLLSDLDTGTVQKFNCTSGQESSIPKSAEKQDAEIGPFPSKQAENIEPRYLEESNLIESVGKIENQIFPNNFTEAKQQESVSKLIGEEGTKKAGIRDDLRCITGIHLQDTHGKVSLESKGELSRVSSVSMNCLSRANSCKWPVVHSKVVNTADLREEGLRLRRSLNDLKSIRCEENASTSQSSDACSKQSEIRLIRQMSVRKLEIDNPAMSSNTKVPSGMTNSAMRVQNDTFQIPDHGENAATEVGDSFIDVFESSSWMQSRALEHTTSAPSEEPGRRHQSGTPESITRNNFIESVSISQNNPLLTEMDSNINENLVLKITTEGQCCPSDIVSNMETQDWQDVCTENCENSCSCSEQLGEDGIVDKKQAEAQGHEQDRKTADNDCCVQFSSDLVVPNEQNIAEGGCFNNLNDTDKCCQNEVTASHTEQNSIEIPTEPSFPSTSEENGQSQDMFPNHPQADGSKEESTHVSQEENNIKADAPRGLSRSLTLEEATDTILFCSSIVHSLVYKAATIAMEKENCSSTEVLRPMVTIVGKTETDHRNSCARASGRRTSKFHKIKSRQTAAHLQAPSCNIETNLKNQEPVMHVVTNPESADTLKPPTINSKCNCTIM
ncbi:hypothetical protein SUGI_0929010 [Cryptomeria japonica]|uniref:uncharacterized protein LOC131076833 n=1 Tax=Cryptomeria japonica TaxID=3369 RepID=UPI0024149B1A|nr:uncharacterized protein LOC131076833 [Cryptomeria japonica]XP_057870153.2 uncharacterized protein LOC131076833 [Cryptomeria japonica]XP_057870154.2 uncharacterized protein LOC131076833 [Cryptomeria japonica]GLJ44351.1 hypothetical protein SUGI_0929010 [Cryptomeria japonica]